MKKLYDVVVLTFAANFLAVAALVLWLYNSGAIDRQKIAAIRQILFPPTPSPQPATRPAEPASTTQPILRLEELLAKYAGRPPTEQLEYIRRSFDSQMAQLDRAQRELLHLQGQVVSEKEKLAKDRAAFEEEKKKLAGKEQQAERLATDKGFQDCLTLYQSMPAKQAKTVFMTMDDQSAVQYLQAMESRAAAKIMKEYKSPEELDRLKRILDKMRQSQATIKE